MIKEIIFVSGNANKISEMTKILDDTRIKVVSQKIDLPEYQESMVEISNLKAKHAYSILKNPVFVEDTSLCFDALHGMPGPYVKWFVNCNKSELLERLKGFRKMLVGFDNFKAEAVTVISYYDPSIMKDPVYFIGSVAGQIVEPRGSLNFDWDCVFEPNQQCQTIPQTYSEMDINFKNQISNRFLAGRQFKQFLIDQYFKRQADG